MVITLKAARVNRGLKQSEAAVMLGITPNTLRKYEKCQGFPSIPMIKKIEEVYGLSYNEIIFLPSDNG